MKRSNRLVLLIGVFLAALAFVFVIILLSNPGPGGGGDGVTPTAAAELDTVVAARDIPLGVTVTAAMVTTEKIKTPDRAADAYGSVSQAIGQTARTTIIKGQQVVASQFATLQAHLECPAGFTCMAVQVDQVSGVGTLINTGDYIDLIAQISPTFPINYFVGNSTTPATGALYDPTSVKMLLQGIQVVGTLLPPPPTTETGVATPAPGTTLNGQQEIVILAVTQQQAEVIKFAQVDGNITLALRSPKDFVDDQGNPIVPATTSTTGLVLKTMVDNWGVLPPLPIIIPAPEPLP